MSNISFFFDQDDDAHWYKVDSLCRAEWTAWRNLSYPGADASDEEWNAFETPPEGADRCEHPNNYIVLEVG